MTNPAARTTIRAFTVPKHIQRVKVFICVHQEGTLQPYRLKKYA